MRATWYLRASAAAFLLAVPAAASAHFGTVTEQIFGDSRFWFFLMFNALLVTVGAWHVVRFLLRWSPAPMHVAASLSRWAYGIFAFSYVCQSLHHVEHVAQVHQYWLLQLPASQSHGIVWFADLEWNHFIFNASYELTLLLAALGIIRVLFRQGLATPFNLFLTCYPLIIQGWHVVEHTVRITQHMQVGCNPCPGILDTVFGVPLLPLHYWFDLTMLFLQGVMLFWFGFHLTLRRRARREPAMSYAAAAA